MISCCYKTCNVSHIYHKVSSYRIGDFPHSLEINCAAVCRCACYDQLRLALLSDSLACIIIEKTVLIYAVRYRFEIISGYIGR